MGLILNRALFRAIVVWGAVALGLLLLHPDPVVNAHPVPFPPTKAERLMTEHGCWSGPAPHDMEGRMPGHVVVTRRKGQTVYGGPALTGEALDQVFNHKDHGLVVHGFCR